MAYDKICQVSLLILCLILMVTVSASPGNPFGQTFQINTRLNSYVGRPSWILIIRDEENGQILPYEFDFFSTENAWVGFTFDRSYRIISSRLQFGPPNGKIDNFCHLEGGIIRGESFTITLTGDLTPNRYTNTCHISRYKSYTFPIVDTSTDETTTETTTTNPLQQAVATKDSTVPLSTAALISSVTTAAAPAIATAISKAAAPVLSGAVSKT